MGYFKFKEFVEYKTSSPRATIAHLRVKKQTGQKTISLGLQSYGLDFFIYTFGSPHLVRASDSMMAPT